MLHMNEKSGLIKNYNWYDYPDIYNIFSFSEDKEEKCIDIIKEKIFKESIRIFNPIDLGAGTGKIYDQLFSKINFDGNAWFIENNNNMINFLQKKYKNNNKIKIVNSTISSFEIEDQKSNFIISSFGFPSCIYDKRETLDELKRIYENLLNDGIFITIGWNEKWNDEVSSLWEKYTNKDLSKKITGARNCGLTWLNNNIETSLVFKSIEEKKYILRCLFGSIMELDSNKLEFKLNMGITFNTKKELETIIKNMEEYYERN